MKIVATPRSSTGKRLRFRGPIGERLSRVKAFYTVAELATMTGYTPRHIQNLIKRLGIRVLGGGRQGATIRVPVSEVMQKLDVSIFSSKTAESLNKTWE